ncbi:hypothetical protein [Lentibacter sp. XHP0401]|jgi:hypothetical protein|uniref:hypothetical protein n=1 Tax=Lentibacter sp. XHP0401 TaxID=2984334 RepID=UPI0021E73EB0|nr:hypothetical protein [Lentibacter sp. XHP0401]MCV2892938.1 hypothetical protein [Lentibacter sp. XHP0401]
MIKRTALTLFSLLALAACAAPEGEFLKGATAPAPASAPLDAAPVMVEEAPMHTSPGLEVCDGDGIGGTGCPES